VAAVLLGLVAATVPFDVDAALRRAGQAQIRFVATGNRGVRVVGRSNSLWVSDTPQLITVMVPLASLRTGTGLRDKHMRDRYLHVARHPDIRLDVPWAKVQRPPTGGTVAAEAEGTLHLHGQTRLVRFRYTARDDGGTIAVTGAFRVDLRDFDVEVPRFLGIHLHPLVDATASFQVSETR
jgi:polyisoprenoid-binding protein YceI